MSQNRHSSNRHSSNRRKIKKNRNQRRKSGQQTASYETLEDRRLLAFDTGIDITSTIFGRAGSSPPNLAGGIGPAHIVEVVDSQFRVYDKADGTLLVDKPLDTFWTDTGGPGDPGDPGAEASTEMVAGTANSRVIYDADTRRWFISSTSTADIITGADGTQAPVLVAVSRTSNPTQDWRSLTNTYDEDVDPETPRVTYQGGFLSAGASPTSIALGVDKDNLYVTVGEAQADPQTWVFNKRSDLVIPNPVSTNPSAAFVNSPDLQWVMDVTGTNVGAFGLFAPRAGTQIGLTELTDAEVPGGATFEPAVAITVDPYQAPPSVVRQEFDANLINSSSEFSAHVVRHGNSLWAVHSIMGTSGDTSAVRWYEIDLDTNTVSQSGTIEHATDSYIYPSIAVTEKGHIVIGYTSTGRDLFPSATVSVGYSNNGVMTMEDPVHVKDGEGGYFDGIGNFWGQYTSTIADPSDPDKVWVYGQWSDDSDDGQTQIVELTLTGLSPEVLGTADDNVFIIRRSALDNAQIEILIDDVVMQVIHEEILYSITIDGNGGTDTFVIDTTNGEMDFPGGVDFIGDGNDQVEMRSLESIHWEMGLNGSGIASVGNEGPLECFEAIEELVTFQLNFEEGSAWFDETPWNQDGYVTYGDALRGELQGYFDQVMAPIFAGTSTVALDINDNETTLFASSEALGWGFEDVGGQNLWVSSPWSILTGRGDRNGSGSEGIIAYNLDLDLYGGDRQALLDGITGGLTRTQFFEILGMDSFVANETPSFDPRGDRNIAMVLDVQLRDLNDAPVVGNYNSSDSTFGVLNYVTNSNWAGDNSGIYFVGIDDAGNEMRLPVNSNTSVIEFDTLASSIGGTSRDGDWNDIIEQDRAFLRGLGYNLNPINAPIPGVGMSVVFTGMSVAQGGDGSDQFCIRTSNVDMEIRGGFGNDAFSLTGLGVGAMNVLGEGGNDFFRINISPVGVMGSELADLNGGDGEDTFHLIHSGVSRLLVNGDAGMDTFNIENATGTAHSTLTGGDDNDVFNVVDSGLGELELEGNAGDDTFNVVYVDAGIDFSILDSIGSENDALFAVATDGDDEFEIYRDGAVLNAGTKWSIEGVEDLNYDGLLGEDRLDANMGSSWSDSLTLRGGGDDDVLTLSNGGAGLVTLMGEEGDDDHVVHFTPTTTVVVVDSIGSEKDSFFGFGTPGEDLLTITGSTADVNGGQGVWSGIELVEFDALSGDDVYMIDAAFGKSRFNGGADDDTFEIATTVSGNVFLGNAGDDVFNVATTDGGAEFFGGDDNDLFNIGPATGFSSFFGELGTDRFVVTNHVALGSFGLLEIDGGGNRNELVVHGYQTRANMVTITNDLITGMSGIPINYTASGSFSIANQVGGIQLNGSDNHNDGFDVKGMLVGNTIEMLGAGGDDLFTARKTTIGSIRADGQEGSDLYRYSLGTDNSRHLHALDTGVTGKDRLVAYLTDSDDQLNLSGESFSVHSDFLSFNKNFESLIVNARGGNDTIDINHVAVGFLRVLTKEGNDQINIHNFTGISHILLESGAGDDSIIVNVGTVTGVLTAYGGTGDDYFRISQGSYGNAYIDGQEGSDRYDISIADRSTRFIVARDSGVFGEDELTVRGTVLDDVFILRSGLVSTPLQQVYYNEKTEVVNLMADGGEDTITVYGISSAQTNVMADHGNDLVVVNSTFGPSPVKVLNVDLGAGNDNSVVVGTNADTTTTISGGQGNDSINIGSSLGQNNGNLDLILGSVHVEGNGGINRLYLNDVGKGASYDYNVGPSYVSRGDVGSSRFAGVTYGDSMSKLRLDTTDYANLVNVTASMNTSMNFFGGSGLNSITLLGDPSDDGREFTELSDTSGFWTFTNGQKDVYFEEFDLV